MADEPTGNRRAGAKKIIAPGYTFGTVTDQIASVVLTKRTPYVLVMGTFAVAMGLLLLFLLAVGVLFTKGLGIWGLRGPTMWAWDITNFVWWVGIGHAGTLISAILLLLNQQWRNSINRFAEAMTIFAVACAGMFPILHLGRPWLMYWLFPYPNTMGIQPNFRSPLVWDVFAVSTYATVSVLFWYVGLLPDLATLRDRSEHRCAQGQLRHPGHGVARFGQALGDLRNRIAAARRTGDAAGALGSHRGQLRLHGRHRPRLAQHLLPAVLRGGRHLFRIRDGAGSGHPAARRLRTQGLITDQHLDNAAKVMMATGLIVGYSYIMEAFTRLVQRQRLRAGRHVEPHDRALQIAVLDPDCLQRDRAAMRSGSRRFAAVR